MNYDFDRCHVNFALTLLTLLALSFKMSIIPYIFRSITYILILVNAYIAFKMTESVKSAKSVMSFFYYTSQAFSGRKRYRFLYILNHSLYIVLIMSLLCA